MEFEWDSLKADKNLRKHGVSFHEAATALADDLSITYHDPDHSAAGHRFITVGMSRSLLQIEGNPYPDVAEGLRSWLKEPSKKTGSFWRTLAKYALPVT